MSEINQSQSMGLTNHEFDFSGFTINYELVQPILQANCYCCHKPNGGAPFSLMSYKDVKKRAAAISDVLKLGIMPPWSADNNYSHFLNAPAMNDSTRTLLLTWIDKGGVDSKIFKTEMKELNMGTPISFQAETYEMSSNEDAYYYTRIDPKLSENFNVSYVDYTESNPRIVHHRTIFIDTLGTVLDKEYTQDEYDAMVYKLNLFSGWSKGMIPYTLSDNFYFHVPENAKFLIQTHYEGDGNKGEKDKFKLNLYPSQSTKNKIDILLKNKFDITYLANEITTETLSFTIEDTITVVGISPHMHYLCKKAECYAMVNGEKVNLLKIPNWNYYFQGQYLFETPIMIPAGAKIFMDVVIDNSDQNEFQPNSPIRDVRYGQGSTEEMLVLSILKVDGIIDRNLKVAQKIVE